MAQYKPPEHVQLMIGACHRSAPLIAATQRILQVSEADRARHIKIGLHSDFDEELEELIEDLQRYLRNPVVKKNDTSLQMHDVAETMVRVRWWLIEMRMLAAIALSLDTPAMHAAFSPAPETRDSYPRDLLEELDKRLAAAKDLRARCEDIGLDERFLSKGKRLSQQLKTAIGKTDLNRKHLKMEITRHYMKKGHLLMLLKRICRQGQYIHRHRPDRAGLYHLDEIEPPDAAKPKKRPR